MATSIGCGEEGPPTYHVSGSITYGGNPVPAGTVMFTPDVAQGNSGPAGIAPIQNGRYDTRFPDGRGTVGGPHKIRVTGLDGVPTDDSPKGGQLFPEWSREIDLPQADAAEDLAVPADWKGEAPAARRDLGV